MRNLENNIIIIVVIMDKVATHTVIKTRRLGRSESSNCLDAAFFAEGILNAIVLASLIARLRAILASFISRRCRFSSALDWFLDSSEDWFVDSFSGGKRGDFRRTEESVSLTVQGEQIGTFVGVMVAMSSASVG